MTRASLVGLIACALAACALAACTLAACTVDRRSDGFACKGPQDCAPGRACEAGWCVTLGGGGDASTFDAPVAVDGAPDAPPFVCPPGCTRCESGVCIIECLEANACDSTVMCPSGVPCHVRCTGLQACQHGVNCASASACEIECTNGNTCIGPLTCGRGRCEITCSGTPSCTQGIECSQSCACDVQCSVSGVCVPAASCPSGATCDTGPGCTSDGAACDKCP